VAQEADMITKSRAKFMPMLLIGSMLSWVAGMATANALEGKVLGGGQPIANSTVTLWAASEGAPQLDGSAIKGPPLSLRFR
jgi:hypothetical protein